MAREKTATLSVRVSPAEKAVAERAAREIGVPLSIIVRRLLADWCLAYDVESYDSKQGSPRDSRREVSEVFSEKAIDGLMGFLQSLRAARPQSAPPPVQGGGVDESARSLFTTNDEEGGET